MFLYMFAAAPQTERRQRQKLKKETPETRSTGDEEKR